MPIFEQMNKEKKVESEPKKEKEIRDEEIDTVRATDIARRFIKKNFACNLIQSQFKLEHVRQNGTKTRYIVIMSIVPDLGEDRQYYLVKVDVVTGNVIPPVGVGKEDENGNIKLKPIEIPTEFED